MSTRTFDGGSYHSVFLTEEGVFVSGLNTHGQLGVQSDSSEAKTQKVTFLEKEDIVSVGCCEYSISFLTKDGKMFAYGGNAYGQLGTGDTTNKNKPTLVSFPSSQSIKTIACGLDFMMALISDGKLFGWGKNIYGQLGVGHTKFLQEKPLPIKALSSYKIRSVACGHKHTLVLTEEGKLFSWGLGLSGQLGHGDECDERETPTLVSALSSHKITQIACGGYHSMALIKEGNKTLFFSWGSGIHGQSGHGDREDQLKPKLIEALKEETIDLIDCGGYHSLAMTKEGKLFTWGDNKYGQLCLGDRKDRVLPTQVKTLNKKDIVHCCCSIYVTGLISREGKLLVCGNNNNGQLGLGNIGDQFYPVEVPLPSNMLLPLNISIKRAMIECARVVLLVLSPFFNSRKRKRERTQVRLYLPREIWLEIFRRAFFDDLPLISEKEKKDATLKAWKMGMKK